jgi:hypothetical protein
MEQDLRVNFFSQIPPTSCRAGFGTLLRSGLSSSPGTYQCPRRMMYAGTILSALCSGTYEAAEPLCVVSLRAVGSMCSYCVVVCSYYEAYGICFCDVRHYNVPQDIPENSDLRRVVPRISAMHEES